MGSQDEFTSVHQLERRIEQMKSAKAEVLDGVNHFGLESPLYANQVSDIILKFIRKIETD